MYPKLITLGPITLHTYGLLAAIGLLVGIYIATRLAPGAQLSRQQMWNLGVYIAFAALLGGKLLLLLFDWRYYTAYPAEIFSLRSLQAGGVYFGGVVFGVAVAYFYARHYQLSFGRVADVFAPGVALGTAIGRVGCFSAGCCWGKPTDLPWAVTFTDPYSARLVGVPLNIPLHPTQLYEAAALLVIFVFLLWLWRRHSFEGQIFAAFILLYAAARFGLEFFRGDPRSKLLGGLLSAPQAISIALVVGAAIFWWWQRRRRVRARPGHAG